MSLSTYVSLQPLSQREPSISRLGALGSRLATLRARGVTMPLTWVLDADAFETACEASLPPGHDLYALLTKVAKPAARLERAARARARLLDAPLEPALERALGQLAAELELVSPRGFAVRASATVEDESVAAMAELDGMWLDARGAEGLGRAVRAAWASAFAPTALAYLTRRGTRDLAMALVLQPMVDAEITGTLFTRLPRGYRDEQAPDDALIRARNLHRGERGGAAHDDEVIRIDRKGRVVGWARRARGGDGTAGLGPSDVARLATIRGDVEAALGARGYAVAFAIAGENAFTLAARPLEGAGFPEGGDAQTVWSRSLAAEAVEGVVSPLGQSVLRPYVDAGLREGMARLGLSVGKSDRLVEFVHGRLYANVSALAHGAGGSRGLWARAIQDLGGAVVGAGAEEPSRPRAMAFYSRLPVAAARLLAEQGQLTREVERFERTVTEATRSLVEIDVAILPDEALAATMREARALVERAGALHVRATTAAYASHATLRALIERGASVRDGERIALAITTGLPSLESARAVVAFSRLVDAARDDEAASKALSGGSVALAMDIPNGGFRAALARFLDDHGETAIGGADAMVPRFREAPGPLLAMVRAALDGPARDAARQLAVARAAADRKSATIEGNLSSVEREAIRSLRDRTRSFLLARERVRGWLGRALAIARSVALEVDRRLLRVDRSLGTGAAFFCTYNELIEALATGRPEVAHLVRGRREEHARRARRAEPPLAFIGTPSPSLVAAPRQGQPLGVAASSGRVRAPAYVLGASSLTERGPRPGDIIVGRTFYVGLAPLLVHAGGLVVEAGGALSSTLVLARELGVPAVIDRAGAAACVRDGDEVTIDGDTGEIDVMSTEAT